MDRDYILARILDFVPQADSECPAELVAAHHALCSEMGTFSCTPLLMPAELVWERRAPVLRNAKFEPILISGLRRIYLGASYFHYYRNQLLNTNTAAPTPEKLTSSTIAIVHGPIGGVLYKQVRLLTLPNEFEAPRHDHQVQAAIGALVVSAQGVIERILDLCSRLICAWVDEQPRTTSSVLSRRKSQEALATWIRRVTEHDIELPAAILNAAALLSEDDWAVFEHVESQEAAETMRHEWAHGKDLNYERLGWPLWYSYLSAMHFAQRQLLHLVFSEYPWVSCADWFQCWGTGDKSTPKEIAENANPFTTIEITIEPT